MSKQTPDFFNSPPTVELLESLVDASLKQKDVLLEAIRSWVILRSLYGHDHDPLKLNLGVSFTYSNWRDAFFRNSPLHKKDAVPPIHSQECPCGKTIINWLFEDPDLGVKQGEWRKSFCRRYSINNTQLDKLLNPAPDLFFARYQKEKQLLEQNCPGVEKKQIDRLFKEIRQIISQDDSLTLGIRKTVYQSYPNISPSQIDFVFKTLNQKKRQHDRHRPFGCSRKIVQNNNFPALVQRGWLDKQKEKYCKLNPINPLYLSGKTMVRVESMEYLSPELAEMVENYNQPLNGISRLFIYVEYVPSNSARDKIGDYQDQLKHIWSQTPVVPVELTYDSASLWREVTRIVYPVCIYYYQRAPYLCAFGQTPQKKRQLGWYNYRLDRVVALKALDWGTSHVPATLRSKCEDLELRYQYYSPDYIKTKLTEALGFDFYLPEGLMILRFKRDFHDRYIEATLRHDTFEAITTVKYWKKLIKSVPLSKQQQLKAIAPDFASGDFAYYCLKYRVGDNSVIMRLRAWGHNVEVLFPHDLRARIQKDLQAACQLYQESGGKGEIFN